MKLNKQVRREYAMRLARKPVDLARTIVDQAREVNVKQAAHQTRKFVKKHPVGTGLGIGFILGCILDVF